eukprot:TRINITY_DN5156_c0_g1_i2.p1 TRINITY_DN5156_c0_g1~~TRINITY_DN5156_c0_g1_i2.p1  ORF type:complete len:163 (+),score=21.42 TRINITY_DN5156_c0_g1_i2:577-1065(+)
MSPVSQNYPNPIQTNPYQPYNPHPQPHPFHNPQLPPQYIQANTPPVPPKFQPSKRREKKDEPLPETRTLVHDHKLIEDYIPKMEAEIQPQVQASVYAEPNENSEHETLLKDSPDTNYVEEPKQKLVLSKSTKEESTQERDARTFKFVDSQPSPKSFDLHDDL